MNDCKGVIGGDIQRFDSFKQSNTTGFTDSELKNWNEQSNLMCRVYGLYCAHGHAYAQVQHVFGALLERILADETISNLPDIDIQNYTEWQEFIRRIARCISQQPIARRIKIQKRKEVIQNGKEKS